MSKVYKVELYITDIEDYYYGLSVNSHLTQILQRLDMLTYISKITESDEFEWDDDLRINYVDATSKEFEEYFRE